MGVRGQLGAAINQGGAGHALGQGGIFSQPVDGVRQGAGIAGRDQQAVLAVADIIHDSGRASGHHRLAGGHGFEENDLAGRAFRRQKRNHNDRRAPQQIVAPGHRNFPVDFDIGRQIGGQGILAPDNEDQPGFQHAEGLQQRGRVAQGAADGQDKAFIRRRKLRLFQGGVHWNEPEHARRQSETAGHEHHFRPAVGQDAERPLGDPAEEGGFDPPGGCLWPRRIQEHFGHDLPGGQVQQAAEHAVGQGDPGTHGDHHIKAGAPPEQPENLPPHAEFIGGLMPAANGGGGFAPDPALHESHVGQDGGPACHAPSE